MILRLKIETKLDFFIIKKTKLNKKIKTYIGLKGI